MVGSVSAELRFCGVRLGGLRVLGGHRGGGGSVCRAGVPWGAVGWDEIAWGP